MDKAPPIVVAAGFGNKDAVKALRDAGADPNAFDEVSIVGLARGQAGQAVAHVHGCKVMAKR